ncbi:MAG: SPASM domain-containing protein [Deltaproteobacteria bacterium]|nr:SPASM domain-containing protein [Deltaproteobacteria bacterium]
MLLAINWDRGVCLCDCQPEPVAGSLKQESLASLWNGPAMREHRRRMVSQYPPRECMICPRF